MKIIMEPTTKLVDVNGVKTRLWQGHTENGIACHAYVALVGVDRSADTTDFERELREVAAPRPDLNFIPLRMILD